MIAVKEEKRDDDQRLTTARYEIFYAFCRIGPERLKVGGDDSIQPSLFPDRLDGSIQTGVRFFQFASVAKHYDPLLPAFQRSPPVFIFSDQVKHTFRNFSFMYPAAGYTGPDIFLIFN